MEILLQMELDLYVFNKIFDDRNGTSNINGAMSAYLTIFVLRGLIQLLLNQIIIFST